MLTAGIHPDFITVLGVTFHTEHNHSFLPKNQHIISISDLRERVANIMQTRK